MKIITNMIVLLLIFSTLSCQSKIEFKSLNGFHFNMTKTKAKSFAKHNKIVFDYKQLAFNKKFGDKKGTVFLIFENKFKLNAFDIRFYPYMKKPEDARKYIFYLRKLLTKKYGKGKNVTKAHKNFSTLYSIWELKNATILLGVFEKDFKFLPKLIIIQKI